GGRRGGCRGVEAPYAASPFCLPAGLSQPGRIHWSRLLGAPASFEHRPDRATTPCAADHAASAGNPAKSHQNPPPPLVNTKRRTSLHRYLHPVISHGNPFRSKELLQLTLEQPARVRKVGGQAEGLRAQEPEFRQAVPGLQDLRKAHMLLTSLTRPGRTLQDHTIQRRLGVLRQPLPDRFKEPAGIIGNKDPLAPTGQ